MGMQRSIWIGYLKATLLDQVFLNGPNGFLTNLKGRRPSSNGSKFIKQWARSTRNTFVQRPLRYKARLNNCLYKFFSPKFSTQFLNHCSSRERYRRNSFDGYIWLINKRKCLLRRFVKRFRRLWHEWVWISVSVRQKLRQNDVSASHAQQLAPCLQTFDGRTRRD